MNNFYCKFEEKRLAIVKGFFARNLFFVMLSVALICDLINYSYNNPELVTIGNVWYLFVCIILALPQVLKFTVKFIRLNTHFTIEENLDYIEVLFSGYFFSSTRKSIIIKDIEKIKYFKFLNLITIRGSITKCYSKLMGEEEKKVKKRGRLYLLRIKDKDAAKQICSNEIIKVEVVGG